MDLTDIMERDIRDAEREQRERADRDFAAWIERIEREAPERARAMSNYELLNATERKDATAADR